MKSKWARIVFDVLGAVSMIYCLVGYWIVWHTAHDVEKELTQLKTAHALCEKQKDVLLRIYYVQEEIIKVQAKCEELRHELAK